MKLFQFTDDFSRVNGRHTFRMGADHRFYRLSTSRPQSPFGFYQFNGLTDFLEARAANVELTLPGSELQRNWRQSMTSAYFEDTFQATQRLVLNVGIRYERVSVPGERDGFVSNIRDPLQDTQPTVGPMFTNPSNLNFAPRVGVAWDPIGDGRTSIRSGFGVLQIQSGPISTPMPETGWLRFIRWAAFGIPSFRARTRWWAILDSCWDVRTCSSTSPHNPYTMQYNLAVQRQLRRAPYFRRVIPASAVSIWCVLSMRIRPFRRFCRTDESSFRRIRPRGIRLSPEFDTKSQTDSLFTMLFLLHSSSDFGEGLSFN